MDTSSDKFVIPIISLYVLTGILSVLDMDNKIPEEFVPEGYLLLLGTTLGWGFTVLNQGLGVFLVIAVLICLLVISTISSFRRRQSQTRYDQNYIIRSISEENRRLWNRVMDSLDKIEKAINKINDKSNDNDKPKE